MQLLNILHSSPFPTLTVNYLYVQILVKVQIYQSTASDNRKNPRFLHSLLLPLAPFFISPSLSATVFLLLLLLLKDLIASSLSS